MRSPAHQKKPGGWQTTRVPGLTGLLFGVHFPVVWSASVTFGSWHCGTDPREQTRITATRETKTNGVNGATTKRVRVVAAVVLVGEFLDFAREKQWDDQCLGVNAGKGAVSPEQ